MHYWFLWFFDRPFTTCQADCGTGSVLLFPKDAHVHHNGLAQYLLEKFEICLFMDLMYLKGQSPYCCWLGIEFGWVSRYFSQNFLRILMLTIAFSSLNIIRKIILFSSQLVSNQLLSGAPLTDQTHLGQRHHHPLWTLSMMVIPFLFFLLCIRTCLRSLAVITPFRAWAVVWVARWFFHSEFVGRSLFAMWLPWYTSCYPFGAKLFVLYAFLLLSHAHKCLQAPKIGNLGPSHAPPLPSWPFLLVDIGVPWCICSAPKVCP